MQEARKQRRLKACPFPVFLIVAIQSLAAPPTDPSPHRLSSLQYVRFFKWQHQNLLFSDPGYVSRVAVSEDDAQQLHGWRFICMLLTFFLSPRSTSDRNWQCPGV